MTDINRELADLLFSKTWQGITPDFTTDSGKIELLRLMMIREDRIEFFKYLDKWWIPTNWEDLMTDTTGRLAQAACEWLKKEVA
jgi:hypothetical protein